MKLSSTITKLKIIWTTGKKIAESSIVANTIKAPTL